MNAWTASIFALSLVFGEGALGAEPSADGPPRPRAAAYSPKAERREILAKWEKSDGAKPPEIVAGIYELDYLGCDFGGKLALSVDDCLPNRHMADVLDILKRRGVKAAFFIVGSYFLKPDGSLMPRARELIRRVVNEGHVIGSHGYWHKRLDEGAFRDDRAKLREELDRNEVVIDEVLGYRYPVIYFRPPNGAHSTPRYELDRLLLERGQYLANWTITSFDWCVRLKEGDRDRLTPRQVIERTVSQAAADSGGLVLLHGFPETAALLDELIDELSVARGPRGPLEFSTIDEIMAMKYGSRSTGLRLPGP